MFATEPPSSSNLTECFCRRISSGRHAFRRLPPQIGRANIADADRLVGPIRCLPSQQTGALNLAVAFLNALMFLGAARHCFSHADCAWDGVPAW
jgi:hypothetical protein